MILPSQLIELLSLLPSSQILVIDMRSRVEYEKSHIFGALNFRIPVNFIHVATQEMMASAFSGATERNIFIKWRDAKYVIFYDRNVDNMWEVPQVEALFNWWQQMKPSWTGQLFVLKGPYHEVRVNEPKYIATANMSDEARSWARHMENYRPPSSELAEIEKRLQTWLDKIQENERFVRGVSNPSKEEEKIKQLENRQKGIETEFKSSNPELWQKALSLQHTAEPENKGKENLINERSQAACVEPLLHALEHIRESKSDQPLQALSQTGPVTDSAKGKTYCLSTTVAAKLRKDENPQLEKEEVVATTAENKEYNTLSQYEVDSMGEDISRPDGGGRSATAPVGVSSSGKVKVFLGKYSPFSSKRDLTR